MRSGDIPNRNEGLEWRKNYSIDTKPADYYVDGQVHLGICYKTTSMNFYIEIETRNLREERLKKDYTFVFLLDRECIGD